MRILLILLCLTVLLAAGCGTPSPVSPPEPTDTPTSVLPPAWTATSTEAAVKASEAEMQVVLVIDDFEVPKTDWIAGMEPEYDDSSSTSAVLSWEYTIGGMQSLELAFAKTKKPKAVYYVDRQLDLSQGSVLQFDLFHESAVDGAALALVTGMDSVRYESVRRPVASQKAVAVAFDLTAKTYKTAATHGQFSASLADLDAVTRLEIILYPEKEGTAYLDNIVLLGTP